MTIQTLCDLQYLRCVFNHSAYNFTEMNRRGTDITCNIFVVFTRIKTF